MLQGQSPQSSTSLPVTSFAPSSKPHEQKNSGTPVRRPRSSGVRARSLKTPDGIDGEHRLKEAVQLLGKVVGVERYDEFVVGGKFRAVRPGDRFEQSTTLRGLRVATTRFEVGDRVSDVGEYRAAFAVQNADGEKVVVTIDKGRRNDGDAVDVADFGFSTETLERVSVRRPSGVRGSGNRSW